jgi:hypothetical protein
VGWLGRKTSPREKQGQTRGCPRIRPAWLIGGNCLGFAEKVFAGGQAAAALADIIEVFEFALAIMLFMGFRKFATIAASRLPLGITEMPGLFRHGSAGGTDMALLFH